jgi:heat shock protein HslJ
MACAPDVMDQEGKFLSALEAVNGAPRGDKLLLLDGGGRCGCGSPLSRSSARLG